jgi:hypothetical protein
MIRISVSPLFFLLLLFTPSAFSRLPAGEEHTEETRTEVVFVSDTQSPLWPEMLFLPSNRNTEARAMIFDAILSEKPGAVFHVGDIVALGFWDGSWEAADEFVGRLTAASIPFFPTRGNHELMVFPRRGEANFARRFPEARRSGYGRTVGPLAVLLLNSNFRNLTADEVTEQQQWYEDALVALDADTSVKAVIVACHHPPYTNSTIVGPSSEVQERFVPPFLGSRKGVAFLSGHAHAMESFSLFGKRFLVIGGGGGLQQPLLTGDAQRWDDEFPVPSEKRMFHYLRCVVTDEAVVLSVRMLKDDFSGFHGVYALEFPLKVPVRSGSP